MKNLAKKIFFGFVSIFFFALSTMAQMIIAVTPSNASQEPVINSSEDESTVSVEAFNRAIDRMLEMDQYQVSMKWTDLTDNHLMGQAFLLADESQGDLLGRLRFFSDEFTPMTTHFNFVAYRHFELAYVQSFKYWESLGFFKQAFFPYLTDLRLAPFVNYYLQVDNDYLQAKPLSSNMLQSLLLLPNRDKLNQVAKDYLVKDQGNYRLSVERLEIPAQFFEGESLLNFTYRQDYELNPTSKDQHLNQSIKQEMNFVKDKPYLAFNVDLNTTISQDLAKANPSKARLPLLPPLSRKESLSTAGIMDKLTKFSLDFDVKDRVYRVVLEGMTEYVDFNLLSTNTANLQTRPVRFEYTLRPVKRPIPSLGDLPTMNQAEANYYMERLLESED